MKWFYRCTAVHFILTAVTGVALYLRRGGSRPGMYSDTVKEWLVMLHNGEWVSHATLGRPFFSGIVIGVLLAFALTKFSLMALRKRKEQPAKA